MITQNMRQLFKSSWKNNPTFVIETYGKAKSGSTFGDLEIGKFGNRTIEINYFITYNPYVHNLDFVDWETSKLFSFDVGAKIGI